MFIRRVESMFDLGFDAVGWVCRILGVAGSILYSILFFSFATIGPTWVGYLWLPGWGCVAFGSIALVGDKEEELITGYALGLILSLPALIFCYTFGLFPVARA